jgi:hypothetical protein
MTKYSSKIGQGPTGPQHSLVTRPESLRSDQFHLECFDLLQCDNLLLSKFLDYCVVYWPFYALFCGADNLFNLGCLALNFSEQVACFLLEWMNSLGDFHHFTLQHVYLLLSGVLFWK